MTHLRHAGLPSVNPNATSASYVKCKKKIAKGSTYLCPSCGHQGSEANTIGHCLQHFESYIALTVNQRSDCIESVQFCPIRLSGTHDFDNCLHKVDPKNVCGVNGCTKYHHCCLHGGTTPFVASINTLNSEFADLMHPHASVLLSL